MTPKSFSSIHSPRAELDQFRIKNNKMNTLLLCVEWEGGRHGFYRQPIHSNFVFYLLTIGN